jgi:phospholipid/cholesterol/gamma-HCH transport system substrate-binding protein
MQSQAVDSSNGEMRINEMRWRIFSLAALAGIIVLTLLFVVLKPFGHKFVVKAYFTNAVGLRAGASVRLAGVDVGSVKTVLARPEMRETPVEVVMVLNRQDDLNIPADSTAMLLTEGVLGETFVEINTARASGPPISANSVLKTQPVGHLTTDQIMEKVSDILKKACEGATKKEDAGCSSAATKKGLTKDRSH